ncbi:MAG: hypothetical protein GXP58_03985 [Deltaproteobacteria bacterium]|nr:hypothetical protein [Deltaproteobacteria bacterium]
MKGFFLVMMTISLLIVCLLVVKDLSRQETQDGGKTRITAIDRAEEAASTVNQRTDEINKKLQQALEE